MEGCLSLRTDVIKDINQWISINKNELAKILNMYMLEEYFQVDMRVKILVILHIFVQCCIQMITLIIM